MVEENNHILDDYEIDVPKTYFGVELGGIEKEEVSTLLNIAYNNRAKVLMLEPDPASNGYKLRAELTVDNYEAANQLIEKAKRFDLAEKAHRIDPSLERRLREYIA